MSGFHLGHALAIPAFLALPVTAVAPAGMGLVFGLGVLAMIWSEVRRRGLRSLIEQARIGPWKPIALLLVFAAASAPFAFAPAESLHFMAYFASVSFFCLAFAGLAPRLEAHERPVVFWALHAGWAAGIVVLGVEVFSGNGIALGIESWQRTGVDIRLAHHNRGASVLVMMLAPLLGLLWRAGHRGAAALVLLLSIFVLSSAESSTAKLALLTGAFGAVIAWLVGHRWPRALAALVGIAIFAMPLLGRLPIDLDRKVAENPEVKISAFHRFYIWRFAADRIAERPILGWGIDASRRIPGGTAKSPVDGQILGLHPHNVGVQLWLELGAIGGALGGAIVGGIAAAVFRRSRAADRAIGGFALAAALTFALLSFGAWQGWWLGLLALTAALVQAATYPEKPESV